MSKKRHHKISIFGSQVTSVISVALVLLVMGIMAMTGLTARAISDSIRSSMGFVVELRNGTAESDVNRLKKMWGTAPYVASQQYTSAADILEQESQQMGEDIINLLDANPYNAEFDIKVRQAYANADSLEKIAAEVEADPAVERVNLNAAMVDNVDESLGRITTVLGIIGLTLLVISFALINNTVSLSIYSRRFTIHTMRLVGAKASFIRRPFIVAGAINGLISAAVAISILIGAYCYTVSIFPPIASLLTWQQTAMVYIALIALGIAICMAASAMAASRYLRQDYDDLFRK